MREGYHGIYNCYLEVWGQSMLVRIEFMLSMWWKVSIDHDNVREKGTKFRHQEWTLRVFGTLNFIGLYRIYVLIQNVNISTSKEEKKIRPDYLPVYLYGDKIVWLATEKLIHYLMWVDNQITPLKNDFIFWTWYGEPRQNRDFFYLSRCP